MINRRSFIRTMGGCACLAAVGGGSIRFINRALGSVTGDPSAFNMDLNSRLNLAQAALDTAAKLGASYADFRLCRYRTEYLSAREHHVDGVWSSFDSGFFVRVLVNGTWGYASSPLLTPEEAQSVAREAIVVAQASQSLQKTKFVLEDIPVYQDTWEHKADDPFIVPMDEKVSNLIAINEAALKAGASYASANFTFVREEKLFASSRGSRIEQSRVRVMPDTDVTVVDKASGEFASCNTLAAPRGSGYEYLSKFDFVAEAAELAEHAKEKLKAKSVVPGVYDVVLDPTNLWLLIHESVGHATELDRSLGWEADLAGTTFVTPDQLGKLKYGSKYMTILADRTQEGGLSTVAYDDDGVKTSDSTFPIVQEGTFMNFQMAIGQAQLIGKTSSNGCAFADSWGTFPIQRMPNVSLQPNPEKCSKEDLFSDVSNGIYIVGNGSWSIDQQRHNFQFGGQRFYAIRDGKLAEPLRDVAYQSSTVPFWNSLDGLGDKSTYFLGGAPNCGKGEPEQSAPVSHGAVPARFRRVNVINTGSKV